MIRQAFINQLVCLKNLSNPFHMMKKTGLILCLSLLTLLTPLKQTTAKTTSVVTFNSEYGLILIDSNRSRAAFDLFESLNVPVQNGFFYQTKIFAPKDKTFRIACTSYGASHVCAVIVYPSKYASSIHFRDSSPSVPRQCCSWALCCD